MSILNALIVDDERPARKELAFLLKDIHEVEIKGEAGNIEDAVNILSANKIDLVFLDIQLSGETGFELLKNVKADFKVIFVTAYNEYAIKAFDVNASDYLLKPVDPDRLRLSIKRILEKPNYSEKHPKKFEYTDSVYVKLDNCTARFIEINTIAAISPVGNYSKIVTTDGNSYIILKTLKQWEAELPAGYFIRIHRSAIVNMKHIESVNSYSKNHHQIKMKNIDNPFEVSRSNFKKLKKLN